MATRPASLLKLQIGPVQDFIAQARSTRDLWSGSYLLSWLVAAGIRKLRLLGGELVFPNRAGQPLLDDPSSWAGLDDHTELLTPNFTNLFVAIIPPDKDATGVVAGVRNAIAREWDDICSAVWLHSRGLIDAQQEDRFKHQVGRFLSISWQITSHTGTDYGAHYRHNAWQLDAVRQTRDFNAWGAGFTGTGTDFNKDSLSGKEEALAGGRDFIDRIANESPRHEYAFLFKHDDWVGAITLVKRVWHLAYLKPPPYELRTATEEFPIRSTRAIAAKSGERDDIENVETAPGDKYFAVLAFDGDQIGMWLSDEFRAANGYLESYHSRFSAALSAFALKGVRPIVEQPVFKTYGGFLVYAGGDDVLALLPAERALQCARELRESFRTATAHIVGEKKEAPDADGVTKISPVRLDASVGLAIAHFKAPFQDVVRAAQAAEKRAKQKLGRSAVAVSLFKRSGEITEWGCQWDGGGLQLYDTVSDALAARQLSRRFPYRVAELLQPYLTETSQLTKERRSLTSVEGFDQNICEIIQREFVTALNRQTPLKHDEKKTLIETTTARLKTYLQDIEARFAVALQKFEDRLSAGQAELWERPRKSDILCGSLIGLCQTAAFVDRNRDDKNQEPLAVASALPNSAERQPVE